MRFLSQEWAEAVTAGLNASDEFKAATAKIAATIQQVVTEAPEGEDLHYWLSIDKGAATMGVGDATKSDIIINQSYATAVALATGELSAVAAYMSGKLQVSNVMKAMGMQAPLQALAPVIRSIDCEY